RAPPYGVARRKSNQIELAQLLVEVGERPLPRELRRRRVEAGRRVVVEPVLGSGVDVTLVAPLGGFERRFVGRPAGVDALVDVGGLNQERGLDLRHVLEIRGAAVEG